MASASSDTFSKLFSSKMVEDEAPTESAFEDDKNPEMQSAHAKIVDAIAKKSPEASLSVEQAKLLIVKHLIISITFNDFLTDSTYGSWTPTHLTSLGRTLDEYYTTVWSRNQ